MIIVNQITATVVITVIVPITIPMRDVFKIISQMIHIKGLLKIIFEANLIKNNENSISSIRIFKKS